MWLEEMAFPFTVLLSALVGFYPLYDKLIKKRDIYLYRELPFLLDESKNMADEITESYKKVEPIEFDKIDKIRNISER